MGTPESLKNITETKLNRIAWLSKQDSNKKFDCLMHLFNYESLVDCFHKLDKNKAVGIDGLDKETYGLNLDENIKELITKMKNMAYRPGPVRETLIPKEGKPGATRPLGISNFEDKIVQKMMQQTLESIYDPLFLECSYGFRRGKGCHDAIKALHKHLFYNNIQTVIDIDLKNFFGTIDQSILTDLLQMKIKDFKLIRYIKRMFKAGILSEGELSVSEEGVVQGSTCSPILANIFAHYAIDIWIKEMVIPNCKGTVSLFRYADDAVICCEKKTDAIRIKEALGKRLGEFNLQLNEEKTKLVSFDREEARQNITQETFDFLGFTFYLGKSRAGKIIPKLKTKAKGIRTKLNKVTEWIKKVRNKSRLKEIWKTFQSKIRGHIQYYGVSFNKDKVELFIYMATRIIFKWLNRRSQRKSFTWEKFNKFLELNPLPKVEIKHRLF